VLYCQKSEQIRHLMDVLSQQAEYRLDTLSAA